jgi:invasion protein IalB
MQKASTIVHTALAILLSVPVAAQTTETPAEGAPAETAPAEETAPLPGGGLALGEPVDGAAGLGDPYIGAEFTDWVLRCVRTDTGNDPCQLYQLLSDEQGNSVAEISVFPLPDGEEAEAGVTIITPLETLLTEQVVMRVDEAQPKRYPFTFCSAVGCVSRIGLLAEEVESFRRGTRAQIRIVPAAAPDQQVILDVSLAGFTAGFQTLVDGQDALEPAADDGN